MFFILAVMWLGFHSAALFVHTGLAVSPGPSRALAQDLSVLEKQLASFLPSHDSYAVVVPCYTRRHYFLFTSHRNLPLRKRSTARRRVFGRFAERPPLGLRVEPTTLGYRLITSSRCSDQTLKDVDMKRRNPVSTLGVQVTETELPTEEQLP